MGGLLEGSTAASTCAERSSRTRPQLRVAPSLAPLAISNNRRGLPGSVDFIVRFISEEKS